MADVTVETPTAGPAPRDERLRTISPWARLLQRPELGSVIGAVLVFAWFALTTDTFAQPGGIARWTDIASTLGIMAVVVALLMIGGEFDLSAGVMTGTSGLVVGLLISEVGLHVWLAIILTFAFALAVGFTNGMLVIKTGLPSFIVTLGSFFVLRGANLGFTKLITDVVRVENLDEGDGYVSAARVFASTFWPPYNFRVSVLWWLAIAAVATWVLMRTRFGNWIFSAGGDPVAARKVGVPVARTKIALFMTTSAAAALVGIMLALRLKSAQASEGVGREFEFIIAAVAGGCLLTGGYGSAIGASVGALIMGMAFIGIPASGWNTDWRFLFLGVILFGAVLVNELVRRRAKAGRA
ncbi:MAG: ABC transporter permease [Acidimicrobiales bacterium]